MLMDGTENVKKSNDLVIFVQSSCVRLAINGRLSFVQLSSSINNFAPRALLGEPIIKIPFSNQLGLSRM